MAIAVAPSARANIIAVEPMPLVPPCTKTVSPARRRAAREEIVVDGKRILRKRRGFDRAPALRNRQHLARRHRDVFGVAAAIGKRADSIAALPTSYASPRLRDRPRDLEAENLRRAGTAADTFLGAASRRRGKSRPPLPRRSLRANRVWESPSARRIEPRDPPALAKVTCRTLLPRPLDEHRVAERVETVTLRPPLRRRRARFARGRRRR